MVMTCWLVEVWMIGVYRPIRTQGAALRALGRSLADVAGFMHEVELEMGLKAQGGDKRGVERLRLLALRMEHLPQQKVIRDKVRLMGIGIRWILVCNAC